MKLGRGVIFALPHMGNVDHAAAWINLRGAGGITAVAVRLKPESVYQAFVKYREALGMEMLPLTEGVSSFAILARRLRAGRLMCIVGRRRDGCAHWRGADAGRHLVRGEQRLGRPHLRRDPGARDRGSQGRSR